MNLEYRVCRRIVEGHDFYEGIRAQVIDKDRKPRWQPDALAGVSDEAVAAYFTERESGELVFDGAAK